MLAKYGANRASKAGPTWLRRRSPLMPNDGTLRISALLVRRTPLAERRFSRLAAEGVLARLVRLGSLRGLASDSRITCSPAQAEATATQARLGRFECGDFVDFAWLRAVMCVEERKFSRIAAEGVLARLVRLGSLRAASQVIRSSAARATAREAKARITCSPALAEARVEGARLGASNAATSWTSPGGVLSLARSMLLGVGVKRAPPRVRSSASLTCAASQTIGAHAWRARGKPRVRCRPNLAAPLNAADGSCDGTSCISTRWFRRNAARGASRNLLGSQWNPNPNPGLATAPREEAHHLRGRRSRWVRLMVGSFGFRVETSRALTSQPLSELLHARSFCLRAGRLDETFFWTRCDYLLDDFCTPLRARGKGRRESWRLLTRGFAMRVRCTVDHIRSRFID